MTDYQHLHTSIDNQQIFWLGIDVSGSTTNLLNSAVLDELSHACVQARAQDAAGLVIYSAKPGIFSEGLDISILQAAKTKPDILAIVQQGQQVCQQFENLGIPTVALLAGSCQGGGLDLALAMDYRIAADSPETRLGSPETRQGIHPAFGGTVRLIARLGMRDAMSLMLNGYSIPANEALHKRLVDTCVPTAALNTTALQYIAQRPAKSKPPASTRLLNHPAARLLLASQLRSQLAQRQIRPEQYPAPHALVSLWQKHGGNPQAMFAAEAESVAELALGDTAQNLMRLDQVRETLKSFGDRNQFKPQRVHVIGAGHLGREIAAWCSLSGLQVTLQDINPETIPYALARAETIFAERYPDSAELTREALARIRIDHKGSGIADADVVIEAIPDKLANKQELFAHLEERTRADALLATTSSNLPLEKLAAVLLQPERLVGLHFLYPLTRMDLVEVIHANGLTHSRNLIQACAFVRHLHKLPLPVHSTPGLLVNRILLTYIMQGIRLHQQNVPSPVLDKAGRDFGMPLGPLELADLLGLDYCRQLGETLAKFTYVTVPDLLIEMTNNGKLGCKNGSGFYRYRNGRMLKPDRVHWEGNSAALQDKLISQMSEEAALCLEQGIVENPDLLDAAVVFGAGFAPFRGGPLHYARSTRK